MPENGSFVEASQANAQKWASLANASHNKSTLSLAQQLLGISLNSQGGGQGTSSQGGKPADGNNESPLGRIIDVLTTPLAAVAGAAGGLGSAIRDAQSGQGFDPLKILEGAGKSATGNLYSAATGDPNIEGKGSNSFVKVLQDAQDSSMAQKAGLKANDLGTYRQKYNATDLSLGGKVAGFAGDIVGDPLTYVGGAGLLEKLGIKGAQIASDTGAALGATKFTPEAKAALETSGNAAYDANAGGLFSAAEANKAPDYLGSILANRPKVGMQDTQIPVGPVNKTGSHLPADIPVGGQDVQGGALFTDPANGPMVPNLNAYPAKAGRPPSAASSEAFAARQADRAAKAAEDAAYANRQAGIPEPKAIEAAPTASQVGANVVLPPAVAKAEKLSADVAAALAPVAEKAGVSAAQITAVADAAKVRALASIPMFNEAAQAVAPVAQVSTQASPQLANMLDKIMADISPAETPNIVPAAFGANLHASSELKATAFRKALETGVIPKSMAGARVYSAARPGVTMTIEDLVAGTAKYRVAPGPAAAAPGAVSTVKSMSQEWLKAAEAAGLTKAQIKRIQESSDYKKTLEKIAAASEAKASSTAKSAAEAGVDPAITHAATDIPPRPETPIPQDLVEGAITSENQVETAHRAAVEIAGSHPNRAHEVTDIAKKRADVIKTDIRATPSPEIAKLQRERLGITHSVYDPKGISRANPYHQKNMFSDLLQWAAKKNIPRAKGSTVTKPMALERARLAFKAQQAAEQHLVELGHPPLMYHPSNAAFRFSEFLTAVAADIGTPVEELIIRLGWVPKYSYHVAEADKELVKFVDTAWSAGGNAGLDAMAVHFPRVNEYLRTGGNIQAALDAKVTKSVGATIADFFSMRDVHTGQMFASDAQKLKTATNDIPQVAADLVAREGGSDAALSIVRDEAAQEILGVPDTKIPAAMDSVATRSYNKAGVADATVDHQTSVLETIDEHLGNATPAEKIADTENRILNWLVASSGYKDLYPAHMMAVQGAQSIANLYLHIYAKTVEELHLTPELMANTWKVLRGEAPATEAEQNVVNFVNQRVQNVMRGTEVANMYRIGTSTTTRAGLVPAEINRYLKEGGVDFQFPTSARGVKDPASWMDAWKQYDGKLDPMEFAMKLEAAVLKANNRKGLFADLHYNHGQVVGGVKVDPIKFPELANSRFTPEVAKQIPVLYGKIDEVFSPSGEFGKMVDTFLSSWKTIVTIPNPSHHIRNVIGDAFFAYLAGVPIGNPALIRKMSMVLRAKKEFYKDISPDMSTTDMLLEMMKGRVAERSILNRHVDPTEAVSTISGRSRTLKITANDYFNAAFERGILKHSGLIEDIPSASLSEKILEKTDNPIVHKIIAPTGGKFMKGARGVSESREHSVRILHFIDKSEKAIKKNLARGMSEERAVKLGFDEAAASVQKWHPDGSGMTDFERKYMRRIFPFYSWTRKAIPLMMETMMSNPAKLTLYPKVMHDLVGASNQQDLANPWPTDQAFPAWLREMPIGPFGSAAAGYTVLNPSNPFTDLGNQFVNDPKGGIASMINPLARVPAEVMFKTDMQTGAPIKDWGMYADKQVPQLALANRLGNTDIGFGSIGSLMSGQGPLGQNNTGKATGDLGNKNAIINWLTAAGLINASQPNYIKQAQYEQKDRMTAAAQARKQANQ